MSIARVVALAFSATTIQVAVLTALECSIAIIVTCFPPLRLLFRRSDESRGDLSSLGSDHSGEKRSRAKPTTISIPDAGRCNESIKSSHSDLELVDLTNGRHIFKNVDFEITSERGSTSRPAKVRTECWDV